MIENLSSNQLRRYAEELADSEDSPLAHLLAEVCRRIEKIQSGFTGKHDNIVRIDEESKKKIMG